MPEMQLGLGSKKGHGTDGTEHGSEEGGWVLSFAKFNFSKPQASVPCPFHRLKGRMTLQSVSEKGLSV